MEDAGLEFSNRMSTRAEPGKATTGPAAGQQQGVTIGARAVTHGGVPLAPVGFEAQRQSRQRRPGLRERGVGGKAPAAASMEAAERNNPKRDRRDIWVASMGKL